jgi:hypothetical protein
MLLFLMAALEGEDGAGGMVENVVADATEEEFAESGAATSSDEDKVGVPVLGGAADHDSGIADVLTIFGGDSGSLGFFGEGLEPVEVLAFGAFPFLGVALQDGAVERGVEGVDAGVERSSVAFLEDGEDVEEHEVGLVGLGHVDRLLQEVGGGGAMTSGRSLTIEGNEDAFEHMVTCLLKRDWWEGFRSFGRYF